MMQHTPSHTSYSTSTLRPVVMITGASSGIGRALAEQFAARGHDLLLIARGAERLALTAARIRTQHQVQIDCLVLDVAAHDAPHILLDYIAAQNLKITVLINNAASWMSGSLATNSHEETGALISANIAAPLALGRAVLPAMIARGDGAILNVGSLAGELPSPGAAAYSASKSFMRSMTLALRHELAGSGVSVSLLVPGAVRTGLTSDDTRLGQVARALFALPPASVARIGYLGMASKQRVIIPGLHVWITYFALKVLPAAGVMRLRASTTLLPDIGQRTTPPSVLTRIKPWTDKAGDGLVDTAQRLRDLARRRVWLFLSLLLGVMVMLSGYTAFDKATGVDEPVEMQAVKSAAALLARDRMNGLPSARKRSADQRQQHVNPGRLTAPGYGIMLYGVSLFSSATRAALECRAAGTVCPKEASFGPVMVVQTIAALLGLVFVFMLAWRLSGAWHIAVLTLVLSYFLYHGGEFAALIRPVVWFPVFTFLAMMLAVEAHAQRSFTIALAAAVGAGAASAVGALFMPLMLVLAPTMALTLLGKRGRDGADAGRDDDAGSDDNMSPKTSQWIKTWQWIALGAGPLFGVVLVGAMVSALLPPSYGDGVVRQLSFDLAQRIGYYNMSSVHVWAASLILPIPGLGGIAQLLAAPETAMKVSGMYQPGNFTVQGIAEVYPLSQAQPGSPFAQYIWLWQAYIIGNLGSYLALIPTIAIKGVWAGAGLFGILGLAHIPRAIAYHKVDQRFGLFLTAFAPIAVLFAANVLLSANLWVNNAGLIVLYAYAMAYAADHY